MRTCQTRGALREVLISRYGRQSLLHADRFLYNAAQSDTSHTVRAKMRCTPAVLIQLTAIETEMAK